MKLQTWPDSLFYLGLLVLISLKCRLVNARSNFSGILRPYMTLRKQQYFSPSPIPPACYVSTYLCISSYIHHFFFSIYSCILLLLLSWTFHSRRPTSLHLSFYRKPPGRHHNLYQWSLFSLFLERAPLRPSTLPIHASLTRSAVTSTQHTKSSITIPRFSWWTHFSHSWTSPDTPSLCWFLLSSLVSDLRSLL